MLELHATPRTQPTCMIKVHVNFEEDVLAASTIIEHTKREMLVALRQEMYKRAAELSIDDIKFTLV